MKRLLGSRLVWVLIIGGSILAFASYLFPQETIDLDEPEDDYAYGDPDGDTSQDEPPSLVD